MQQGFEIKESKWSGSLFAQVYRDTAQLLASLQATVQTLANQTNCHVKDHSAINLLWTLAWGVII